MHTYHGEIAWGAADQRRCLAGVGRFNYSPQLTKLACGGGGAQKDLAAIMPLKPDLVRKTHQIGGELIWWAYKNRLML